MYVNLQIVLALLLLIIKQCLLNPLHISGRLLSHRNWGILMRGTSKCGYSSSSDRIIGGDKARLGQYPWIVRLGYSVGQDMEVYDFECGGTIITEQYILTAAHCSGKNLGLNLVKVRMGEYDASTRIDCVNGRCAPPVFDSDIEETVCHKGYDSKYHNDICLIRLAKPINFTEYIRPICLPVYDMLTINSFAGSKLEVAGWGFTNWATNKTNDVLLTVSIPVLPPDLCENVLRRIELTPRQICAGGMIGRDSCKGDSGGPLMCPMTVTGPPQYFIIGVVSFGHQKCGATTTPGIYTLVTKYLMWILDNIRN